jgi:hypothetical protein
MNPLYVNPSTKQKYTFDCQSCNNAVQTNKIIRKMVRTPASLYTMNLATCHVYNKEISLSILNWNQSSDRPVAHISPRVVPSRGSSVKSSVTRCRPGACAPGGAGVDVKHGSYDRRLAKLKGKTCTRNMVASCNMNEIVTPMEIHDEFQYSVGDFCWALLDGLGPFFKAQIMNIAGDVYTIQFFENGVLSGIDYTRSKSELLIYSCGC